MSGHKVIIKRHTSVSQICHHLEHLESGWCQMLDENEMCPWSGLPIINLILGSKMWRLWRAGGFEEQVLDMDKLYMFFSPRCVQEEGPPLSLDHEDHQNLLNRTRLGKSRRHFTLPSSSGHQEAPLVVAYCSHISEGEQPTANPCLPGIKKTK